MHRTYLIVPAWTDQAGQCRIVSREGRHSQALLSYRESPDLWLDSGIMNSEGRLVCLDDPVLGAEMRADEPLCAGLVYVQEHPVDARPHDESPRPERPRG